MTEDELLREVQKLAKLSGWLMHHTRPARTGRQYISRDGKLKELWVTPLQGDPGFVDCVFAKRGHKPLLVELKTEKGVVSTEQLEWIIALPGHVIRPSTLEWLANKLKEA